MVSRRASPTRTSSPAAPTLRSSTRLGSYATPTTSRNGMRAASRSSGCGSPMRRRARSSRCATDAKTSPRHPPARRSGMVMSASGTWQRRAEQPSTRRDTDSTARRLPRTLPTTRLQSWLRLTASSATRASTATRTAQSSPTCRSRATIRSDSAGRSRFPAGSRQTPSAAIRASSRERRTSMRTKDSRLSLQKTPRHREPRAAGRTTRR